MPRVAAWWPSRGSHGGSLSSLCDHVSGPSWVSRGVRAIAAMDPSAAPERLFQHPGLLSGPPVIWIDLSLSIASRVLQQAGTCSEPACVTDHPDFAYYVCARGYRYGFTRLRFASGTSVACRSDPQAPSGNAPKPSQSTHTSVMASHFSAACVYPDERAVAIWENRYAGSAPIGHRA